MTDGPTLVYLADDFTGATDVLNTFSDLGDAVTLRLQPPAAQQLTGEEVVGIASTSRAFTPDQARGWLPTTLSSLLALNPDIVQYKVCSTFDSAPQTGNIGVVAEIAGDVFGQGTIPVVVGTPALGRYVSFGNLFAVAGTDGAIYRIDQHPVMANHPVTPMRDGDLADHLRKQTDLRVDKLELPSLNRLADELRVNEPRLLLVDGITDQDLTFTARTLMEHAREYGRPRFVIAASGLDRGLAVRLRDTTAEASSSAPSTTHARLLAVSGSCSPVTAAQIAEAECQGWQHLPVDLESPDGWAEAANAAVCALQATNVVVSTYQAGALSTVPDIDTRLAELARAVLDEAHVDRLIICGGDTSGTVATTLGIEDIKYAAAVAPGAPLCRVTSTRPAVDGLYVAFKGGQMGQANYFQRVQAVQV